MAPYSCHLCRFNAKTEGSAAASKLASHYYKIHAAYFSCQYCHQQFPSAQAAAKHTEKYHVGQARFFCLLCPFKSSKKQDLLRHQSTEHHSVMNNVKCRHCGTVKATVSALRVHLQFCLKKSADPPAPPRPPSIPIEEAQREDVKPNVVKETAPVPPGFQCHLCRARFSNRDDHCAHMINVHDAGVLCSFCDKQFSAPLNDSAALASVIASHYLEDHQQARNWQCIYCGTKYADITALRDHQNLANHPCFKCDICTTFMPTPTVRRLHMEFQHKPTKLPTTAPTIINNPNQHQSPNIQPVLKPLCLQCFKRFPLTDFKKHLLEHMTEGKKLLDCNECFEVIYNPNALDSHKACFEREALRYQMLCRTKGNEQLTSEDGACDSCGYCAQTVHLLSRHMGWCHKRLNCQNCGYTAFGYINLKMHECPPQRRRSNPSLSENHNGAAGTPPQPKRSADTAQIVVDSVISSVSNGTAPNDSPQPRVIDVPVPSVTSGVPFSPKTTPAATTAPVSTPQPTHQQPQKRKHSRDAPTSSSSSSDSSEDEARNAQRMNGIPKSQQPKNVAVVVSQQQLHENSAKRIRTESDPSRPVQNVTSSSSSDDSSSSSSDDEDSVREVVANIAQQNASRRSTRQQAAAGADTGKNKQGKKKDDQTNARPSDYVCKVCGQSSKYRHSVMRHLFVIHRMQPEMADGFCEEVPVNTAIEPPELLQQPSTSSNPVPTNQTSKNASGVCTKCEKMRSKADKWKAKYNSLKKKTQKMEKSFKQVMVRVEKAKKFFS